MIVKIFISAICISLASPTDAVLHRHHEDVYKNIDGCRIGRSGANCDIPYELCPDGMRKCFNESQCRAMDKVDTVNGYSYQCDCSYAESVTPTAGYECEHSATVTCPGDHFCTNGGSCGNYVLHGHHYLGCHCLEEFEGAHCQYLKADPKGVGMEGEALVPELGSDFYVQTSKIKPLYALGALSIIACTCLAVASVVYLISYHRQKKAIRNLVDRLKNHEAQMPINDSPGEVA